MIKIGVGDCRELLPKIRDNSIDALITDPPAGISFMGETWDTHGSRAEFVAFMTTIARECLRVMKPGAHGVVWAIPRTAHWTAWALEDAGFEIRDVITHHFGTGFPKSHNAEKAGAVDWKGWGTALKPASEHWILVRKPLVGTVAANLLTHGVGAINVDACRVPGDDNKTWAAREQDARTAWGMDGAKGSMTPSTIGRWPPNALFTHALACADDLCSPGCPIGQLDEQSGVLTSGSWNGKRNRSKTKNAFGAFEVADEPGKVGDSGGASRFFPRFRYQGKASPRDRGAGNDHPTVKSIDLMRWLIRLVTPPRGLVLDPFSGSGSTLVAAKLEGVDAIGIEQDPHYAEIARGRIRAA